MTYQNIMENTLNKKQFWKMFKGRAIIVTALRQGGQSRDIANRVNHTEGRGDASLRTKAEYSALFDLLHEEVDTGNVKGVLTLQDNNGNLTEVGTQVQRYLEASQDKDDFFNYEMYMVHITGWPQEYFRPVEPVNSPPGAQFGFWKTDPKSNLHIAPPPDSEGILFITEDFSVRNSGNLTLHVPKPSWKLNFKAEDGEDRILGMSRLNLKAMYNDPSQMREALAWYLFDQAGVPSSRHTFAKLGINDIYMGLFSLIEQVDKQFLKEHFGKNDEGNLYKAYWDDIGPASLEYRQSDDGDDSGCQYFKAANIDNRTYRLKTNENDPKANNYDDLAKFIRIINGVQLRGNNKFNTAKYQEAVTNIMNVKAFLRWMGVNILLGGWDNYYATPANYYLYNSGKKGTQDKFMAEPYFTWIPWDYDNSFGIDYFDTQWQYNDIIDWVSGTRNYYRGKDTAKIPLVENLLKNDEFKQYYLDYLEYLLDTDFNPAAIIAAIGVEGGNGLWDRVRYAAYLASDTPLGLPHTGRQFTNHEVYRHGCKQQTLSHGNAHIEGIIHYVRMRYDNAHQQLAKLRQKYPKGASGASFSGEMETLPKAESGPN
ncbi:MAG: hypothetical protein DRR19_16950 [Candidatus Parabeggiatoa sp. nov. 1]|nr:MAG: hypothetical protein DRR19_16950 [Gammaproteobacteria bacterium]